MRVTPIGALGFFVLALQAGCAQWMAIKQHGPLDRSILQPGAERNHIAATLGAPTVTNDGPNGMLVDTYTYKDGGDRNQPIVRVGRVLLYTAGDVFTLFLSQLIWMPAELLLDGTDYNAFVEYQRSADGRWIAARVTERKTEGDHATTMRELPGVAASRTAIDSTPTTPAAAVLAGTCFAIAPNGLLLTAITS